MAINEIFAAHSGIEAAIIYGSRVKGNYRTGSDIDIAIKGENLDLVELNAISDELDELYLPYSIDLVIYDRIQNEDLLDHIRRMGVCFYSKGSTGVVEG